MADNVTRSFDKPTLTGEGTSTSTVINTRFKSNFRFVLDVSTLSGGNTGQTLSVEIQESPDSDFSNAELINTLHTFTQVLGNSSGSEILHQEYEQDKTTFNRYIRAQFTTAGASAATTFSEKITLQTLSENRT